MSKPAYADLVARDGAVNTEDGAVDGPGHRRAALDDGGEHPGAVPAGPLGPGGVARRGTGCGLGTRPPYNGGAWPLRRNGLLQVAAGTGNTIVRPALNTFFRIFLPKATDTTVTLTSTIDPALVPHFEYFASLDGPSPDGPASGLQAGGRHWSFSSKQALHGGPCGTSATGAPGDGGARRRASEGRRTRCHDHRHRDGARRRPPARSCCGGRGPRRSTTRRAPANRRASTAPCTPDRTPAPPDDVPVDVLFRMHSTKRIDLTVDGEAISRFVDYFTQELNTTFTAAPVLLHANGVVASTRRDARPRRGRRRRGGDRDRARHHPGAWSSTGAAVKVVSSSWVK